MKATLYSSSGDKKSEVTLPPIFSTKTRADIAQKFYEAEKYVLRQRYASYAEAGKRHSASGLTSHRRHKWKTGYGKGLARLPRKIMSRRGTQFNWVGAETSQTRGGRMSHPPKGLYTPRKINKKEMSLAIASGLASTANPEMIVQRYASLNEVKNIPAVIESMPKKTKDFLSVAEKIFGAASSKVFQIKHVRSGKGKRRARKYKSSAGLLVLVGKDENVKISGVEVKTFAQLRMRDLYPLGRLALYTQKSLQEMQNAA